MHRLAVIGSGIAGLGIAYHLKDQFELTIYEKNNWLGGHANTVAVREGYSEIPIDTGFMVFNRVTYPNLVRLFEELGVRTKKTDMSFSVQHKVQGIEYAGVSANRLFGNRRNLLSLRFWKLLREIERFNEDGSKALSDLATSNLTVAQYARKGKFSDDFIACYLLPMSAAIWSTPPEKMLSFPAITLLRFFKNHGLLGVQSQHQWYTVEGGSREYIRQLLARMPQAQIIQAEVAVVKRRHGRVFVTTSDGNRQQYDHVILACHADEALTMLHEPRMEEKLLLGAFAYQRNDTLLHTDSTVMPEQKRCWASWNYRLAKDGATVHYWMNNLQGVSRKQDYFVTLNGSNLVNKSSILKRLTYHHPLFDISALRAQEQLPALNERSYRDQIFFCGSYFGYGFH